MFLAIVASILSVPILLLAREFSLYTTSKPLSPERAGRVADWILAVAREAGADRASILYIYRKGIAMQLVQYGEPLLVAGSKPAERRRLEFSLAALVHRASWNGLAAASLYRNLLIVAVPARTMEELAYLTEPGRKGVKLEVETASELKRVYRLVKELVGALNPSSSGLLAAYTATKLIAQLILDGLLAVRGEALEKMDRLLPAEPWWVRRKVVKQLEEEATSVIGS